jgi:hypothetical protein
MRAVILASGGPVATDIARSLTLTKYTSDFRYLRIVQL